MITDSVQSEQERETPVAGPDLDPPRASRFALSSLEIAENKAAAAKAAETAANVKLPETLAETLALLRQVQATVPKDKFEVKVKGIKMEHLRAHVFALSQAPKPPIINQAEHWKGLREPLAAALAYFTGAASKSKSARG